MKNLKRLTKGELKTIEGGASCPRPATTCSQWCLWTAQQQATCPNMLLEPEACVC